MPNVFFDNRKVKSNDIVNGLARKDIYDSKGVLLVKEGTRISEAHFKRMREVGLRHSDNNKMSVHNETRELTMSIRIPCMEDSKSLFQFMPDYRRNLLMTQ